MNFLILGNENPDYNHPILKKHNDPLISESPLTKAERLARTLKMLQSSAYAADIEKLRLFYQEKLTQLKMIFDVYLKKYGEFHVPATGLGAWIKLHEEKELARALPELEALGVYAALDNPQLNPKERIVGIRIGFGLPGLDVYEKTFECLAIHFS